MNMCVSWEKYQKEVTESDILHYILTVMILIRKKKSYRQKEK